jgi:hypothetical protein
MSDSGDTKPNKTNILLGIICIAIGTIPLLTTLGIIPHGPVSPDSEPQWADWLIGLVFGSAGILVIMRGFTGSTDESSSALPANAPRLMRGAYDLLSVATVCSLALVFTWVAFGPGPRHFSVSGGGLSMPTSGVGDTMGRLAFGFASVLFWCFLVAIVVATVRRWRR